MSPAGNCEDGFLNLCHRVVPDHIKVDVRQVRQFVRDDNRIDDRGAIEGEGLVDRFL